LEHHRRIHGSVISAISKAAENQYIDCISFRICRSVNYLATLPCTLLALFSLRYSELFDLDFNELRTKKRIKIYQGKNKSFKWHDNTYLYDSLSHLDFDFTSPIVVVTYDYIKRQIRKAKASAGLRTSTKILDDTHLFRHLTASWLNHLNCSDKEISKRLGHKDPISNQSYIHPWNELFTY
jgi:integrase